MSNVFHGKIERKVVLNVPRMCPPGPHIHLFDFQPFLCSLMPRLHWKKLIVDWVPWYHHRTLEQLALSSFPLDLHKQELFIYLLPLTVISLATIFLSFKNIYIYLFGCAGSSYLWLSGSSIFALGSFQLWHVGFLVAAELFVGACGV